VTKVGLLLIVLRKLLVSLLVLRNSDPVESCGGGGSISSSQCILPLSYKSQRGLTSTRLPLRCLDCTLRDFIQTWSMLVLRLAAEVLSRHLAALADHVTTVLVSTLLGALSNATKVLLSGINATS